MVERSVVPPTSFSLLEYGKLITRPIISVITATVLPEVVGVGSDDRALPKLRKPVSPVSETPCGVPDCDLTLTKRLPALSNMQGEEFPVVIVVGVVTNMHPIIKEFA